MMELGFLIAVVLLVVASGIGIYWPAKQKPIAYWMGRMIIANDAFIEEVRALGSAMEQTSHAVDEFNSAYAALAGIPVVRSKHLR